MGSPNTARLNLEKLLQGGRDGALLRFGLGGECIRDGDIDQAVLHLQKAVTLDPNYSAAWKLLGKALTDANRESEALVAYQHGIAAAQSKGDKQAMKEMQVFARRLQRLHGGGDQTVTK